MRAARPAARMQAFQYNPAGCQDAGCLVARIDTLAGCMVLEYQPPGPEYPE